MADTRIQSLNMLLDPTGKMFLAEEYGKVIENVQKLTISGAMKNTELILESSYTWFKILPFKALLFYCQYQHRICKPCISVLGDPKT